MATIIDGQVRPSVAALWQRLYPDYDADLLADLVYRRVRRWSRVLEIGCGDGRNSPQLAGRVAYNAGIDPDERVLKHRGLDDAIVGVVERLPWPDETFDVIFHRMVAEHLADPIAAMRETARVLKPHGVLLFETPSRWYYPMIAAALTPHRFHEFWVWRFGSGRKIEDVFPTHYRLNDRRQIREALTAVGMVGVIRHLSTPPGYLRSNPLAFLAGVAYERTVERAFPALRGRIIVEARKR